MANLEAASNLEVRSGIQYLPVTMTLLANDDGSGLIDEDAALDGFCRLNQNFESLGIQFYLHNGFRYVFDSDYYLINGPNSQSVNNLKIPNTINIFVSDIYSGLGVGCSGVLGFYATAGDYVAIDKCTLNEESFALSHELGHFFSLPHTFFGWENEDYDADLPTPQFINGVRVEYADESNCALAADRICDTPPDYNFGLGAQGCNYTGEAVDPAGNPVDPDETNFMGYFFNCTSHQFSPIQSDVIYADIASRTFVNGSPNTTTMTEEATPVSPDDGEVIPDTNVTLTWETVEGATTYLVEINRLSTFSPSFVIERTTSNTGSLDVTDLLPETTYYWRVRPFNNTNTCIAYSQGASFSTGEAVSVEQIEGVESFNLYPNPSNGAAEILLEINTLEIVEAEIVLYNTPGQLVAAYNHQFNSSANLLRIKTATLVPGAYIIAIQTETDTAYERFLITN